MSKRKKLAPKKRINAAQAQGKHTIRAKYDAAQTTSENEKHWSYVDGLSADAAASPSIRRTLRNRSRYEVANNSYARGISNFIANDTIGAQIRLSMMTTEIARANGRGNNLLTRDEASFVEGEFFAWMQATGMFNKLRTMRIARCVDGEGFGVLSTNTRILTPVKLDMSLVEAEMVTDPWNYDPEPDSVDGIKFDRFGNPVTYRVLKEHPGSVGVVYGDAYTVPADDMIHLFATERPGQRRGIPQLTPCLPLFAQMRRFTLAVLAAAETAADFAGIMMTQAPAGEDAVISDPFERVEIERRALLTLPEGYDMKQLKPEQPVSTYAEFKREIIAEICRPLEIPINVALGDSSRHNYASGRLDWQTWFKSRRVDRSNIEYMVLDRLFAAWLREAMLIEGYLPQRLRSVRTDWSHTWMWDGDEHVDPQKEANAQATRLANLTTTLAEEWQKKGKDWEEQLTQIARERELMGKLGISMPAVAPALVDDEDEDNVQAGYEFDRDPASGLLRGLRRI